MLDTYQTFDGDIEEWARISRGRDASGITDDDWSLIEELLQGLSLINSGQASPDFSASIQTLLMESTADEQTRAALREMAK